MAERHKNYNIHYTMADDLWERLQGVYEQLPAWRGFNSEGFPSWFGEEDKDREYLTASVEPSGLYVFGFVNDADWQQWDESFCGLGSEALGYRIMDAEEGDAWDFLW